MQKKVGNRKRIAKLLFHDVLVINHGATPKAQQMKYFLLGTVVSALCLTVIGNLSDSFRAFVRI